MKQYVFLFYLFFAPIVFAQGITVMIDPGHGGSDPGHESHDKKLLNEKDLNLKIAQKLGTYLTENLSNVSVVYTRTDDSFPSLEERVKMANSKNVDYFISIHINGSPNKHVKGTESHVHSWNSKSSVKLARCFEEEFKTRAGRKSRGVKDTDDRTHSLQVLKETKMTSVLVECGFITNDSEAVYLNSSYGQDIIASALFRGLRTYLTATHTQIDFSKKSVDKKQESTTEANKDSKNYSVQIMSSKEWIDTDSDSFKKLKYKVTRSQVAQSGYRFKYFTGSFSTKSDGENYLKEVRKQGFPDAILVERSN